MLVRCAFSLQPMPNDRPKRPPPFCLRLTGEERARLEHDAAGMPLGAYIKWRVFDPDNPPPKSRGKFPVRDHEALGRILALLGISRIANNLNQLAKAANSGSLVADDTTKAMIEEAVGYLRTIRDLLMRALGIRSKS